jgi:type I restriction enzyme R subunit
MSSKFTESTVEAAVLNWVKGLSYTVLHAQEIAPGESPAQRGSFAEVLIVGRLGDAITRLNPNIPSQPLDDVIRKVTRTEAVNLFAGCAAHHGGSRSGVGAIRHGNQVQKVRNQK